MSKDEAKPAAKQRQPVLDLGPQATWRFRRVDVSDIVVRDFGSPPEPELVRSVGISGVLVPVLLVATKRGKFVCEDGRRRVLSAIDNDLANVPAMVMTSGNADLQVPAGTLQTNDTACPNPIVELEAIEELMRQVPGISAPAIAKGLGIKLKTVKARLKLASLRFELRDAWKAGQFGTKVGERAATCDEFQQQALLRRYEAAGTLTTKDVADVKRTTVTQHQRTLPAERVVARSIETLEKVHGELVDEFGDVHASVRALEEALESLRVEAAA